ncbi:MAG: ATP synthase F0 subunit B [Candidatus Eremiobacteraeota bacterium]|nr:ATP synthase F0 subunit B [Candidatus Eremiobacteraeota bacterium]
MLLSIDGTFLAQALNFILFWVLLNQFFIGPTRRAIEQRQKYVANLYHESDAFAAQAKALQSQADAILSEARRQTDEAMRAAAAQAADEVHEIERTAADEAAAIVQRAHTTVRTERKEALEKQQAFVSELARSMVVRATDGEQVA